MAGASPGPGRPANPFARYQAELRGALLAEVKPADLRAVVRQVLRIAKRGHVPTVELLLKWVLGGPPPALDPHKLDGHEREVRTGRLTMLDHLALVEDLPADDPDGTAEDEAATGEAAEVPTASPDPPLRTVLVWALEELTAAQTALQAQPPDPMASWEAFAAHRLQWEAQAAVPVDLLFVTYARWAASRGEPVLAEDRGLAWLTAHGATVRTGPVSQVTSVVGVRVNA